MDRATIGPAIRIVLTEIHCQTERGRAHRKSRRGLRLAGSIAEAVAVSMDIEQLIYGLVAGKTRPRC